LLFILRIRILMDSQLLTLNSQNSLKPIIYQLMPRWFTNTCDHCIPYGTIAQNGCGHFNDIDTQLLRRIADLGATHVWYTGIIEHATATDYSRYGIAPCDPHVVKGLAGSPYAIRDYYDVDPDLATDVRHRMDEFQALVERTHRAEMKVIIDFVPNHVARQYASDAKPAGVEDLGANDDQGMFFSPNNNFFYITGEPFAPQDIDLGDYKEFPARATGNDCYHAHPGCNDWYETIKLNYGIDPWNGERHFSPIPDTWRKMTDILLFWAEKGIDGFRCDMVHMVPVEFWHHAITEVKRRFPHIIFIAEIYDTNLYRSYIHEGGFDYLYDKVTLYDKLIGILCHNHSAADLTQCWQTIDDIRPHMLNFLENHDEVRLASRQCCNDPFKALPALVVSATISTAPFMFYAGQELGERADDAEGYSGCDGRTTIFDYWSVPTLRQWLTDARRLPQATKRLRAFYRKLLNLCNSEPAISEGGFYDLMYANEDLQRARKQYAFLRHCKTETLLIVANFADEQVDCALRLPAHALQCAGIKAGAYRATDLLSGTSLQMEIADDCLIHTPLAPNSAVILKLKKSH